jgi:hypothetical protein
MKLKQIMAGTLIGCLILISSWAYNTTRTTNVPVGNLRFSRGKILSSKDFSVCSAVVLDYQENAVMAHTPPFRRPIPYSQNSDKLNSINVVEKLAQKLLEEGIDPEESQAFVSAGSERSFVNIYFALRERGIPICEIRIDRKPRDVEYNPKTNYFDIIFK